MAVAVTEGLTACGVGPEERESHAREALEKKYHKEFEITKVYSQKFGDLYYEVQAYALDEPEIRFQAAVDTEDDDVSDSYVEMRVCSAISRQAGENLDGLPGYYYLYTYAVGPQPIVDDLNINISDYAALDNYNRFQIELFVSPEDPDAGKMYHAVSKMLEGLEYLTASATLYIADEERMADIQDYLEDGYANTLEYKELTGKLPALEIPFSEGKIEITEDKFSAMMEDMS